MYFFFFFFIFVFFFFFSSRRRHTRSLRDWSSDVCSSDLFPMDMNPYADLRLALPGYDAYVNFNNVEQVDYYTELMGVPVPIRQVLYLALTRQHGLPVPAQFTPARYVEPPTVARSGKVLVFSKAAGNVSRTLLPNVISDILQVYPDAIVDPEFADKWDLF